MKFDSKIRLKQKHLRLSTDFDKFRRNIGYNSAVNKSDSDYRLASSIMARPPFLLHRTTLSLILLVGIGVVNSLIVPTAHSVSLRPDERDGYSQEKGLTGLLTQQPEPSSSDSQQFPATDWNSFTPPDRGVPGRREGGGTRGCPVSTALIPDPTLAMARTISPRPVFFFYLPALVDNESADFLLTDEQGNKIYEKTFKLSTKQEGIVGIKLLGEPGTPPLEDNKKYEWSLILCGVERGGWIERVSLSSVQKTELEKLDNPLQRLNFYAEQGLWFEAIATLANLRASSPNNSSIQNQWIQLLKSVGFDPDTAQDQVHEKPRETDILQAPIIENKLTLSADEN